MADKEFEIEDPFEPVAVVLSTPGFDGLEAMARCFVEEFAMMGWPPQRIFKLFTVEDYAASHAVLLDRGPEYVRDLIVDVMGEEFAIPDPAEDRMFVLTPVMKRTAGTEAVDKEDQDASGI
jgi:hypothetical protein